MMSQKRDRAIEFTVVVTAMLVLAVPPTTGAIELENAVDLQVGGALVTLADGVERELRVVIRSDRSRAEGQVEIEVEDNGVKHTFSYNQDEGLIEVQAEGETLQITLADGGVTVGNVVCDGAGGEWQCIADAVRSQIELSPAALIAGYAALSRDVGAEQMKNGAGIEATFRLLAEDALQNSERLIESEDAETN